MFELTRAARMKWPLFAAGYLAIWTVPGLISTSQLMLSYTLRGDDPPLRTVLLLALPGWYVWALLSPLIYLAARRYPLEGPRLWSHVALHLCFNVLLAAAWVGLLVGVRRAFALPGVKDFRLQLVSAIGASLLTYWGVTLLVQLARDRRERERRATRAAELDAQLSDARLTALKAQLHPHFLFNTMNAISAFVRSEPLKAEQMLAELAALLRTVLDTSDQQLVPLQSELDFVRRYIGIQQIRLGHRLSASVTADDDVVWTLVPSMILQPLVENAVEHGIARRREGGRVELEVTEAGGRLTLEVRDDGPGFTTSGEGERDPGDGRIGLRNTRERLERLYGDQYEFCVADGPGGGTTVRIVIPSESTGPDSPGAEPC